MTEAEAQERAERIVGLMQKVEINAYAGGGADPTTVDFVNAGRAWLTAEIARELMRVADEAGFHREKIKELEELVIKLRGQITV